MDFQKVRSAREGLYLYVRWFPAVSCIILVSGHGRWSTHHLTCTLSTQNMCFSLMHNAETLTNGLYPIICHHSVLSASSDERYTQELEGFIFTCLLTSTGNSVLDAWTFSMWRVGTQMLALLKEAQRKDMIMQSKMGMLSRGDLKGRAEEDLALLWRSRRALTCSRLRTNFSTYTTKWILEASLRISQTSDPMRNGNTQVSFPSMTHPEVLEDTVQAMTDEMSGYYSLEYDMETWS